jgi:hypothetical protein
VVKQTVDSRVFILNNEKRSLYIKVRIRVRVKIRVKFKVRVRVKAFTLP